MFSLGRCVTIATGALRADPGRIGLLRPADQVADPAGLVARGIGRPRPDRAERSGLRRRAWRGGLGRRLLFRLGGLARHRHGREQRRQTGGAEHSTTDPRFMRRAYRRRPASPRHRCRVRTASACRPRTPSPEAGKPGTMGRHERDHDPCRTTRRRPPHRPTRRRDLAGGLCRHPGDAVSRRAVDAAPRDRLGVRHRARAARRAGRGRRRRQHPRVRQLRPQPEQRRMPARSSPSTSRRTGRTRASAAPCCSRCSSGWSRKAAARRSSGCCATIPAAFSTGGSAAARSGTRISSSAASGSRPPAMPGTTCRAIWKPRRADGRPEP